MGWSNSIQVDLMSGREESSEGEASVGAKMN